MNIAYTAAAIGDYALLRIGTHGGESLRRILRSYHLQCFGIQQCHCWHVDAAWNVPGPAIARTFTAVQIRFQSINGEGIGVAYRCQHGVFADEQFGSRVDGQFARRISAWIG